MAGQATDALLELKEVQYIKYVAIFLCMRNAATSFSSKRELVRLLKGL